MLEVILITVEAKIVSWFPEMSFNVTKKYAMRGNQKSYKLHEVCDF
jgi:hypothetical protein